VSAVAELTPDKKDFIITYVVEEGKRYKFGDVKVDSQIRDLDSAFLTKTLPEHKGDWYNAKQVEDTVDGLTETAGTVGYAFAKVEPHFSRNPDTLTMDVTFQITQSPRTYVERVDINGNTLTKDKVVRREFRVAEGDAFNSLAVKRTTNRIKSLGYFQENFEVSQVEGSTPDRIILQANVEEQPTGQLTLSAGYSSLEGLIFEGSIQQKNFRGAGQTVGLSANWSNFSRGGQISFQEPYLFDKNIFAGIDIYHTDYNDGYFNRATTTYKQATTGARLTLGVPLTEYTQILGRYTFNYDDVSLDKAGYYSTDANGKLSCNPLLAGRYLCDAVGKRTTSMISGSLVYQNLDNAIHPTRGRAGSATLDFAGLGGSNRYVRLTSNASEYWPIGGGFVFSVHGEAGIIHGLTDRGPGTDDVRLTDRFFLGQPQMRGFNYRGVGPRVVRRFYGPDDDNDPTTPPPLTAINSKDTANDALGGDAYYLGKVELEIPLGSGARQLGLRPSVFMDVGSVFRLKTPPLNQSPWPNGTFLPTRDASGNPLFTQINVATLVTPTGGGTPVCTPGTATGDVTTVTNPVNPNPPACLTSANNTALGQQLPPFVEEYYGNSASPRLAIGVGVNWNSPFGPLRIDVAYPLLKKKGDDTKIISFNVGTQF
jgi:outer membrane protein insertion porin family